MPTLVLRNLPEDLYQQLKDRAADHQRSLTQEAVVSLRSTLQGLKEPPPRPSTEETLDWLKREVWSLPLLDSRHDDEILGYNWHGYCD